MWSTARPLRHRGRMRAAAASQIAASSAPMSFMLTRISDGGLPAACLMVRMRFSKGSNHRKVGFMTQAPAPDAPDSLPLRPAELAAYLAARMCHDFISPASAIVSGLDLLEDPTAQDMRDDAMSLISASARKLADLLAFTRVAFGASASAETFDPRDLEKLAQGVFG